MHRIATFALSLAFAAATPPAAAAEAAATRSNAVETVGVYSNVRIGHSEDPHAYGYDVELYRHNGALFGLFYSSQGLAGDTPRGRLQDVRFDAASGKLSFRAKLTVGREYSKDSGDDGRPSRDLFEFDGRLSAKSLAGTVLHRSGYRPQEVDERETVKLKLDPQRTRDAREFAPASRAAWEAEPVPNGPEW
ncbi:hypothetical protein A7A76_19745 [Lysobacter enzymogenes]|uniref:hypothetical protein n=1 Tax=Lysobacter enzymogenes TaxID=69 RepID=UPI0019D1688F|nr:hypothetical protein [Lysobacter enzymogenes]MBN7136977.1 hypothetical protein [Lysobacter enzymogenes]